VLFASIHQSWIFPGTGRLADVLARAGEGYSIDLFVEKGSDEDDRRAGRSRPRAASGNKRKPGR
jgi:acetoin utilization deacetylase AcuC-like enzyme